MIMPYKETPRILRNMPSTALIIHAFITRYKHSQIHQFTNNILYVILDKTLFRVETFLLNSISTFTDHLIQL